MNVEDTLYIDCLICTIVDSDTGEVLGSHNYKASHNTSNFPFELEKLLTDKR